ncbi:hypothetical protein SAICODRAFT_30388 [Saitoella complicata NRRL Y-17804]|nr:uncharacterized protein SAICODRAFT_30388 [Saitoella complicata NRRL Y-17804]ODQ52960.1 hypothetical protein SAICODRAFT_30388 [Saitoella complicata NRRL Y-17804]
MASLSLPLLRPSAPLSLRTGLGLGLASLLPRISIRIAVPAPLLGIWDSIFRAAPKKKTSHSRKRMRQATKYLRDNLGLNRCPSCGMVKRAHTLCTPCYGDIKKVWKGKVPEFNDPSA